MSEEFSSIQDGTPIAVLGTGAWGSVLVRLLERNGATVESWSRRSDRSMAAVVKDAAIIVSAISMKGVAAVAEQLQAVGLGDRTIIVSATKGLESGTIRTPGQIWQAAFPHHPVVALSGPNLSPEIDQGLPAATVVASRDAAAAEAVQHAFASDRFRVYTNTDPLGTELGGALKNVIAIAVGACDGLRLGANAKAALTTRALAEIIRVGTYLGAKPETFFGLSGLGDLLATCDGPTSRNYRVGCGLAQGKSLPQVLAEIQTTAEGVNTAYVLAELAAREQILMPVSHQVYRLLEGDITPQQAIAALMERELKPEA